MGSNRSIRKKAKKHHNGKVIACAVICLLICTIGCIVLLKAFFGRQKTDLKKSIQPDIQVYVENKAEENFYDKSANKTVINASDGFTEEMDAEAQPDTDSDIDSDAEHESDTSPDTESGTKTEQKTASIEKQTTFKSGDIIDKSLIDFDNIDRYFTASDIEEGDEVYTRIYGKSYVTNDDISLSAIKYLKIPHYDFDGNIRMGEMIVNASIAGDVLSIFKELFQMEYQIERMRLIDDYWTGDGDSSDTNSVEHNNTSAFCYRRMTGGKKLSKHAYGMAIDINPQQNPYVSYKSGEPVWYHENANDYIDRDTGLPHVITHSDPTYDLFKKYGFSWGGDWKNGIKDYQHFEHE